MLDTAKRQTSLGKRVEIQPHSAVREDSDFESAEVSLEKCAARRESKCLQGFETSTKYSLLHAVLTYCCCAGVDRGRLLEKDIQIHTIWHIYDIYASMCEVPRSEQCAISTEEPSIWSRDGRCRECQVTSATLKFSWKLSSVWRVDMDCRCMLI